MTAKAKNATSVAVVWLRRDLRLSDNPALYAACRDHDAVVLAYCHDRNSFGGAASNVRLHHSLRNLIQSIDNTNLTIFLSQQEASQSLADLIKSINAAGLYWNRLYEPDSMAEEDQVKAAVSIPCHRFKSHLLLEPDDHLKADGTPYRVYTPFWKAMQPKLDPNPTPLPTIDCKVKAELAEPCGVRLDDLGLLPAHVWASDLAQNFEAGELAAQAMLGDFVADGLGTYKTKRDQLGADGTSSLSAALHFGEISPRQILHHVSGCAGAEAFIRQLAWRDFAHHLLFHFPETAREPLNPKYDRFPWLDGLEADMFFAAWCEGRTGINLVDAGMKQLWQTGTMHNRVRMVVASLLVKNMLVDWRRGMDWFHDTLIDADQANNVMGWQWVAGCGADAAPYFRVFNPDLQAEKFDPDGSYRAKWLGENWQDRRIAPVVDLKSSRQKALAAYASIK